MSRNDISSDGLKKILQEAGGNVALLGQPKPRGQVAAQSGVPDVTAQEYTPQPGERCCLTCYYNPTHKVCQALPMDVIAVRGQPNQETQTVPIINVPLERVTPPGYCCSLHSFEHEIPSARRWLPPR